LYVNLTKNKEEYSVVVFVMRTYCLPLLRSAGPTGSSWISMFVSLHHIIQMLEVLSSNFFQNKAKPKESASTVVKNYRGFRSDLRHIFVTTVDSGCNTQSSEKVSTDPENC